MFQAMFQSTNQSVSSCCFITINHHKPIEISPIDVPYIIIYHPNTNQYSPSPHHRSTSVASSVAPATLKSRPAPFWSPAAQPWRCLWSSPGPVRGRRPLGENLQWMVDIIIIMIIMYIFMWLYIIIYDDYICLYMIVHDCVYIWL